MAMKPPASEPAGMSSTPCRGTSPVTSFPSVQRQHFVPRKPPKEGNNPAGLTGSTSRLRVISYSVRMTQCLPVRPGVKL